MSTSVSRDNNLDMANTTPTFCKASWHEIAKIHPDATRRNTTEQQRPSHAQKKSSLINLTNDRRATTASDLGSRARARPGLLAPHLGALPRGRWSVVGKVTVYQKSASLSREPTYSLKNGEPYNIQAQDSRSCQLLSFSAPSGVTKERYVIIAPKSTRATPLALYSERAADIFSNNKGKIVDVLCDGIQLCCRYVHICGQSLRGSLQLSRGRCDAVNSLQLTFLLERKAATTQATPLSRTARHSTFTSCVIRPHSLRAITR
jgi:hypothetical protein